MEDVAGVAVVVADETSVTFVTRWEVLVSTTNWEKGRIIFEWREALRAAGASAPQYSDEAWSRRVGSVSGQHVGRLRRVHERFAVLCDTFQKLSWSHFCAALEWHDAELWLEGAVQSSWSVSEMRRQRWEAFGAVEQDRPREEDVVAAEVDEDYIPFETGAVRGVAETDNAVVTDFMAGTFGTSTEPDDQPQARIDADQAVHDDAPFAADDRTSSPSPIRVFENLGDLPADMLQAFEAFKLSIIQHRLNRWSEVSPPTVLSALEGLKQLVLQEPESPGLA